MRQFIVRVLAMMAAAGLVAAAAVTPAAAHPIRINGLLYKSSDLCTSARLSHDHRAGDSAGGWIETDTYSRTRGWTPQLGWVNCLIPWSRPPGNIRVAHTYWKWSNYPAGWYPCYRTGWYSNQNTQTYQRLIVKYWKAWCESGWYLAQTHHGVWNGAWYGGTLQPSSAHHFPDYTVATDDPPPIPDTLPSRAAILGPDGKPLVDGSGQQVVIDAVPPDTMVSNDGVRRQLVGPDGEVGEEVTVTP